MIYYLFNDSILYYIDIMRKNAIYNFIMILLDF